MVIIAMTRLPATIRMISVTNFPKPLPFAGEGQHDSGRDQRSPRRGSGAVTQRCGNALPSRCGAAMLRRGPWRAEHALFGLVLGSSVWTRHSGDRLAAPYAVDPPNGVQIIGRAAINAPQVSRANATRTGDQQRSRQRTGRGEQQPGE